MRISPETAYLANLVRQQDSARAEKREASSFQADVLAREGASGQASARQVRAPERNERTGDKPRNATDQKGQQSFEPLFAREAPTGGNRPRYVPKGQVMNLLV